MTGIDILSIETSNRLLRQQKQKYYTENLNFNIKNSKRTWDLLKEAANFNYRYLCTYDFCGPE